MKRLTFTLAFALLTVVPAAAQPENVVTVEQASVEDSGHSPIPVAIWAPAAGDGLPLVVISHGTGGGTTSHLDTAQALAEAGFVVVAPTHPGDNFQDDSIVGRGDWFLERSRHISKVIDYMVGEWPEHTRLRAASVGIFGFSAGGTTALISIGGVPDLTRIGPQCSQQPEFVCGISGPLREGSQVQSQTWNHDQRIAAAVIAAPGLGFTFEPHGLEDVQVPVQLWAGSKDQTVPYETNAGAIRQLLSQEPDFYNVEGATHLSFLAPCTPQSPPTLCQDLPDFDRAGFHRDFNQALVSFFSDHLMTTLKP